MSKSFNNNLSLVSNGYHKNYDTNVFEKVLINDLKYTSSPKISSKGLVNKFNILFKNVTTESKNSKNILIILDLKILDLFYTIFHIL